MRGEAQGVYLPQRKENSDRRREPDYTDVDEIVEIKNPQECPGV
jgi:hypothetical protein